MSQIRQTVSGKSKFVSVSKSNIQTLEKVQTVSAQTGKIFEEPNKLARISMKIRPIHVIRVRLRGVLFIPRGLAACGAAPVEARRGGLGSGEMGAQDFSLSNTAKNAKAAKINEFVL